MKKILHSIVTNLSDVITGYLPPAIAAAAVFAAALFAICAIRAYKKGVNSKDALKRSAPAVFSASALLFYITILYYATVLNRLSMPEYDPFSNPYGGWLIEDMTFYYDFSALLNIFMFIPLCLFLIWFLKYALKKKYTIKTLLILCGSVGFLLSAGIEISQIFLKAGTFQFADLFYNTLGAVIGVPVCLVLIKIAQKARHAVKKRQTGLNHIK